MFFRQPLNPKPDSQWSQYFKDNEMLLQIDKDCRRLYPGLGFFQAATEFPCEALTDQSDGIETLRGRIKKTVLKAQDVSKNRLGVTTADVSDFQTHFHSNSFDLNNVFFFFFCATEGKVHETFVILRLWCFLFLLQTLAKSS